MHLDRHTVFPRRALGGSLNRSLLLWFMVLALVPMALVSWVGYDQAGRSLKRAAVDDLALVARQQHFFINHWFDERVRDLERVAGDRRTVALLSDLAQGLITNGGTVADYVGRPDWDTRVAQSAQDLNLLVERYDSAHDILLADQQGNILYSVARESDLGQNLWSDSVAASRFAAAARRPSKPAGRCSPTWNPTRPATASCPAS